MALGRGSVEAVNDERGELRKLELAVRQLERAELYVVAAIELELADPERRRLLEGLRASLVAGRRSLTRPRVLDAVDAHSFSR